MNEENIEDVETLGDEVGTPVASQRTATLQVPTISRSRKVNPTDFALLAQKHNDLSQGLSSVRDEIKDAKKEIKDAKTNTIEALAIFVALFTFVSIDIQIFKSDVSTLSAAGFALIIFACLMSFVIALAYLLDFEKISKLNPIFIFSILVTGALGVFLVYLNHFNMEDVLKEKFKSTDQFYVKGEVEQLASSTAYSAEARLKELKDCLFAGGWKSCLTK